MWQHNPEQVHDPRCIRPPNPTRVMWLREVFSYMRNIYLTLHLEPPLALVISNRVENPFKIDCTIQNP